MSTQKFDRSWLLIDRDALDEDIIRFPERFHIVAEAVAEAQSRRDAAKEHVERVAADLDPVVRAEIIEAGEKDTAVKVAARIAAHPDHIAAVATARSAQSAYSASAVDKEAMQQKSYMLRVMTDLYAANYYTTGLGSGSGARQVTDERAAANKRAMAEDAVARQRSTDAPRRRRIRDDEE